MRALVTEASKKANRDKKFCYELSVLWLWDKKRRKIKIMVRMKGLETSEKAKNLASSHGDKNNISMYNL